MNHDNDTDPIARLHAADPAGDVVPRDGFADEIIAGTLAPEAASAMGPRPVADLATERVRRRPRWIAIAAVAASVAIVGAAGYGLGATTGGADLADGAAPPISLQTGGSPDGITEDGREPAMGGAAPDQRMDSSYPYGYGRNHFSASGLDTSGGVAAVHAFDPSASVSEDRVAAIATAFGLVTAPELRDGVWVVGAQDGSEPSLSVSLDGVLSFYFNDPRIDPWQCKKTGEPCVPTAEPPSEDAAIGSLRSLIVAAGRDPELFEFSSHVWEGSSVRTAEARLVVDGQIIDQAWSLEIAGDGVVNAQGSLADLVDLGEYPVVSEQEGFERLSDPRFGSTMAIMPADQPISVAEDGAVQGTPPATPAAGTSLSWPVNEVEIVSVRLGLASQWQPDGSVLVVPAYEFTDTESNTWSVVAVAESKLDFDGD